MGDTLLVCSHCNKLPKRECRLERKRFPRYVDEVCTTTNKEQLEKLHKNFQLTLNVDANGELAFLT